MLHYHVSIQVSVKLSSLTARLSVLVFLKARLSEARRCLTVGRLRSSVVGHPRPSLSGTGVPWVSCLDPPCAAESRMTLRQRANPLSSWVESCCMQCDGRVRVRVRGRGRSREKRVRV